MLAGDKNSNNISIQLEQSNISQIAFSKGDDQLTEQLYEIARRIAESDRNNDAYRQAKKTKTNQLQSLRRNQLEKQSQYEEVLGRINNKKHQINSYVPEQSLGLQSQNQTNRYRNGEDPVTIFAKKNSLKYQQAGVRLGNIEAKEKQLQTLNSQIVKDNEKIQKKISTLQTEFDIIIKQNKHKAAILSKLKKQKQDKQRKAAANQAKIQQLQDQCQDTKNHAQKLEDQLREQMRIESQLEDLIKQKQEQLELRQRQKEESAWKKQQKKRSVNKLVNTAKNMQNQISEKIRESDKLEQIQDGLKSKIIQMEDKQRKLQQVLNKRKNMLGNLKTMCSKTEKEQQNLNKLTGIINQQGSQIHYNELKY